MAKSLLMKCRTCLKSEKNFQSLEEHMGLKFIQLTYKEALIALTNITIQVDQEEYMPRGICNSCSRKLRSAQQFIKQAKDANSELLSLLRELQQSSPKQLDCLKEPPIDLNVNKEDIHIKLEVEFGDSQIIEAAMENVNIPENVLTVKEESITNLKSEDVNEIQEIANENSTHPFGSVAIDPLPEDCSIEQTGLESIPIILSSNATILEKRKKCKSIKSNQVEGDDLLPIGCEDCGKIYENAEQLARHKRNTHLPEELKIPCPNCGRKFSRSYNMYTHMRKFHGKESVENLLRPSDSINAKKKYQCEKCSCKYTNKYKLHAHIRRKHDAVKEKGSSSTTNGNHKIKKSYTFLCTICGLACGSQSALTIHIRRHTGEKPFKCNLCDKAYPRLYDVQMHRRTHTGEKPHKCNICSKAFRRSNKLTVHMRTHTNERPYKCTQCERCFKQSKDLTIHMRIHTGERPYKCGVCFNTFTQSNSLKAHRMKYGHIESTSHMLTMTRNTNNITSPSTTPILT